MVNCELRIVNEAATQLLSDAVERWFTESATDGWARVEVACEPTELVRWWRGQPFARKVYWSSRDGDFETAALGLAVMIGEAVPVSADLLANEIDPIIAQIGGNVRLYGGFRFNRRTEPDGSWVSFGVQHFMLPRFEMTRRAADYKLAINFKFDASADPFPQKSFLLAEIARLRFDAVELDDHVPNPLVRDDVPNRERWDANIAAALDLFERGEMDKVVLARKVTVDADAWLEPGLVLTKLKAVTPNAFHFCYQIDDNLAFVGASPERLYRREGRAIFSDALASTRRRGDTPDEDARFEHELLTSVKDRHEHGLVLEHIVKDFETLCEDVRVVEETGVIKLAQLMHLYAAIEGDLRDGVSGEQVMAALHPTPAVGGFPRERAYAEIERLEPFDRGWYAAPVGWIGVDSAEFCVAIRSALVEGKQIHAYSGAGIVKGSVAELEWDEIENKLLNFRKALM